MTPKTPSVPAARVLLAGVLSLTVACGRSERSAAAGLDSALSRDLTLAASATPDIALGDTAVTSAPSAPLPPPESPRPSPQAELPAPRPARAAAPGAPRPAPAPAQAPAPAPSPAAVAPSPAPTPTPAPTVSEAPAARRALGAGVQLSGPTNAPICSMANRPGDRFVVSLGSEVSSPDGARLPAGTPVLVELARVDSTSGAMSFRLRGVQVQGVFYPADGSVKVVDGAITERKVSKGGNDAGKVATGAMIGGMLGRVMGGGAKGTIIGAAGGAAAGTIAAARNSTIERCLSAGATLSTTLTAPLVLSPSSP
ncbi:hypothetical protein [Gemmatimonas sp.]|uniref:hypothetical protein n=1 Tax=Gemmatimonas sp. TaxID=1962908 RepID=UPI003F711617